MLLQQRDDCALAPMVSPANEWLTIKEQANTLVKSGLLPKSIRTPEAAIAIMIKGRELGIPAMHAFSHINIIEGKPTMSAELMLNMIMTKVPDARLRFVQNDSEACRIEASRKIMAQTEFGFSRRDAESAELMRKDNWRKYTRAMLRSRAVSEMARSMFPDALCGVSYTPEELGGEVKVTESGEIIVEAEEVSRPTEEKPKRQQKGSQLFVDSPSAWTWLEKMFDSYYLAEDCRHPIRAIAIGKTARELDQLAHLAASGHDDIF